MSLHPGVKALINVVIDNGIALGRRIEAAEALIQHNCPDPVIAAARKFLCEIAEDKTGFPGHRLAAAKAVLRRDLGKFKRARVAPTRYREPWLETTRTVAQRIEDGLRRTAERDAQLERERQLKLVSSIDTPADKAS
jgi:hypothetical protein